jgi:hypothetical protein
MPGGCKTFNRRDRHFRISKKFLQPPGILIGVVDSHVGLGPNRTHMKAVIDAEIGVDSGTRLGLESQHCSVGAMQS